MAEGHAGRWGLLGSPVFHWSLALLIVVVAGGRLMRSEGFIDVPVGASKADVAESYRGLEEGPLFPGHTGLEIVVPEMERVFMDGDVDRGAAPIVVLRKDGAEVASQKVYPNNPLKYGSTTVHASDYGLSPEISLETSVGKLLASTRPLIDLPGEDAAGEIASFDLNDERGMVVLTVELAVPFDAQEPSLDVVAIDPRSGEAVTEERLAVGEAVDLPDGELLRFVATGDYARLSVVHDWSVPFIYALLAVGLAGLSIAILDPYRRVLVMAVQSDDGDVTLNALIRHGRSSVIFEDRVLVALEDAAGVPPSLSEED